MRGKSLTLSVGMYIVLIPMCNPSVWSIGSDDGNVITDNASPTVREKRAVLIGVSLSLSFSVVAILVSMSGASQWSVDSENGNAIKEGFSPVLREKRAFLINTLRQLGMYAVNVLTTNSKLLFQTETSTLYRKTGDYRRAVKDFQSVDPQDVKIIHDEHKVGRDGAVGDRIVKLRKEGYYKRPTIYVIKPPKKTGQKAKLDVIYYKNNPGKQEPDITITLE